MTVLKWAAIVVGTIVICWVLVVGMAGMICADGATNPLRGLNQPVCHP